MTTTTAAPTTLTSDAVLARGAAWGATLALLANGLTSFLADTETLADHTRGAGAVSEATTGVAFLAGAAALAVLTPVGGWRRVLWALAPLGMALAGITMVMVPLVDREPPGWLFLLAVVPTLVGTVAAGVLGTTRRVWPWWTGAGVAAFLPIMFLLPFNSLFMTAVWVCVALTARAGASPGRVRGTGPGRTPRSG